MRRIFPRLAPCGVLAALLIPLLPAQVLAQRHIGGCGGGGGSCLNTVASSDAINPRFPGCAVRTAGSTQDAYHLDSVYEVVQETGVCTPASCSEWIWVLDNVPAGPRYLQFSGHSDALTYSVEVRFCDAGNSCPSDQQPCPTDRYLIAGTITPGPDHLTTVSLGSDGYAGRVCVLLQAQNQPASCAMADHVYMDLLRITNDASCPIP